MNVLILAGENELATRIGQWLKAEQRWTTEPVAPHLVEWADIGVSCGYRHIVQPEVLNVLKIVNIHTGYLPFNRGAYPNIWPILDKSPAGATIHWMDAGLDTGPIIDQKEVSVEPWDTAFSLYRKLEDVAFDLFTICWDRIADGSVTSIDQLVNGEPHRTKELKDVTLDLNESRSVREVLAILRARTFPPYGLVFEEDDKKWIVRVEMEQIDD